MVGGVWDFSRERRRQPARYVRPDRAGHYRPTNIQETSKTMRPSQLIPPTLFLAACAALLLVVPARGNDTARPAGTRAGDVPSRVAPGAGPAAAGCKSVATFASSAVPELLKDGCTGCHAGASPGATGAFDLSSVGKDNAVACAKALGKVNLANKPQSAILQAAAGTLPHGGGKVTDTQPFTAALLGWINNE
jgi:hypothetical protein